MDERNMVEVNLVTVDDETKDDIFNIIVETLTRIGVGNYKNKKLYQTCHILHKQGKYFLVHFKEMFLLDGKSNKTEINDVDYSRRNKIINMLKEWDMIDVVDGQEDKLEITEVPYVRVVSFKEKPEWELVPKYTIGNK